jgi:hypothetical protein
MLNYGGAAALTNIARRAVDLPLQMQRPCESYLVEACAVLPAFALFS